MKPASLRRSIRKSSIVYDSFPHIDHPYSKQAGIRSDNITCIHNKDGMYFLRKATLILIYVSKFCIDDVEHEN